MTMRAEPLQSTRPALVRPRFLQTVHGRWPRPLTTVVAGPGLCKTTLVAQAINEGSDLGHDFWARCSRSDGNPVILARHLASLMDAADRLDATAERGPEGLAEVVAELVWLRAPAHVCFVLEDLHDIPLGSDGTLFVASLVD